MIRSLVLGLAVFAVAACGGPQRPRLPDRVIKRALAGAPGEAQPSKIVAVELAFARAAKEKGQWTAFREFAGPGAIIDGQGGPIEAQDWLANRQDPPAAVQWEPRSIWMSCNGALAVSQGRFRDPDGVVGTFVTVWQRQSNDQYRWIYDTGAPDNPQPPARKPLAPPEEGDIVVEAMDAVQGLVADCPKRGEAVPAPPAISLSDEIQQGSGISHDGTLQWRWEHDADGSRRVVAEFLQRGKWVVALDQPFPVAKQ
ncbi:hypothetical protein [Altererythrobacter sp.]|uniref:hypothetical protein n=1 Tax=Altererythrobacter sp. TaxID=1872480 RepID=UPI003CFCD63D